ncbi:Serine/threonine-protein kinase 3 [Folsomia candida]|uniref:Serine/threonine-protein kinase 3 n=1 Tax=Folsomia candida TaxID=158441 RepID=A0A226D0W2_FOLCA|nr:Serine/threonine-protein kinase 3 [Folsomia candida]
MANAEISAQFEPSFISLRDELISYQYLGSGSFGTTFKVILPHAESIAVKQVCVEDYKKLFQHEANPMKKILREITILEKLSGGGGCNFVLKYYSHWLEGPDAEDFDKLNSTEDYSSSGPRKNWLFIKTEFCNGGDLME